MPEEVKFTEEELKQVQNIQTNYANVQNQFKMKRKNFLIVLVINMDKEL